MNNPSLTSRVTVSVPADLLAAVDGLSTLLGVSRSSIVSALLDKAPALHQAAQRFVDNPAEWELAGMGLMRSRDADLARRYRGELVADLAVALAELSELVQSSDSQPDLFHDR